MNIKFQDSKLEHLLNYVLYTVNHYRGEKQNRMKIPSITQKTQTVTSVLQKV